ncbi:isoprenoid synthase domain-containing protein [Coniella lustricola]|uniref:Terpene synthase n=1 Tax=Coniella lustricola TaxID=2025994 RepID=A0A2T3AD28_9PEZI|nr:isoprenoid synthase domain-containing protein [Coniella lustricola]
MGTVLSPLGYFASSFDHLTPGTSIVEMDPNAALAQQLKGKVIHVDMTSSFDYWPSGARHPQYERLVRATDDMLERTVPDTFRCQKFKKSDFALFACLWWPDASWDDLYSATLFTVCLFVWDDTIDTNEHYLATDFEEASVWRRRSLAYFKYHLRLSDGCEPTCPDDVCILFKEFGERFCSKFGPVQRRRMFNKIEDFVEHNTLEQAERLAGRIPTYEGYMTIRFGVTGVRMFALLLEMTNQTKLPSWVMDSREMEIVIHECNFIIIVVNDILSLKKEIATNCVVNVVPVLYMTGQSLDQVISNLVDEMHASRDRLDAMAAKLDLMTRAQPQLNKDVMRFIDGVRMMDTGTLIYSIESPRYGVRKYQQPDGKLNIVL